MIRTRKAPGETAKLRARIRELEKELEIARQVDDRRKLEGLLNKSRERVKALASGIAHEINNPLASILAASRFALEAADDPAALRKAIGDIMHEARRCAAIAKDLSQIASEQIFERSPVPFHDCLQEGLSLAADLARKRGIRLRLELGRQRMIFNGNQPAVSQLIGDLLRGMIETARRTEVVRVHTLPSGRGTARLITLNISLEPASAGGPLRSRRSGSRGARRRDAGLLTEAARSLISEHGGRVSLDSRVGRPFITIQLPCVSAGRTGLQLFSAARGSK